MSCFVIYTFQVFAWVYTGPKWSPFALGQLPSGIRQHLSNQESFAWNNQKMWSKPWNTGDRIKTKYKEANRSNEQSRQRVLFQCLSFVLSQNATAASHCLFLPSVGPVSASRMCGRAAVTRLHVHSYVISGWPGHGATGAKWNWLQPCHAQRWNNATQCHGLCTKIWWDTRRDSLPVCLIIIPYCCPAESVWVSLTRRGKYETVSFQSTDLHTLMKPAIIGGNWFPPPRFDWATIESELLQVENWLIWGWIPVYLV